MLLVSYVSMGEWQTFDDMLKVDEGQAVLELMFCSLHRADPLITRRTVRKLTRKAATELMHLICGMSIPPAIKGFAAVVSDKEATRNMKTTYRKLSIQFGWTPEQISGMSPLQVYLYQVGGADGTGIQKMTGGEWQRFQSKQKV